MSIRRPAIKQGIELFGRADLGHRYQPALFGSLDRMGLQPVPPGVYDLAVRVFAYGYEQYTYGGRVCVSWEGTGSVPVEDMSWSAVKSLFRR